MERWLLIILVSLFVMAAVTDVGAVITARTQFNTAQNLQAQIQQQQNSINTFVAQLQRCKTLEDVDKVLGANGIQRVQ